MPVNPFEPPKAQLDGPATSRVLPPPAVRNGCFLVFLSFVLGLGTLVPGMRPAVTPDEQVSWVLTLCVVAVMGLLTFWLLLKTYQGFNWARWTLIAYLALGWWLVGEELPATLGHSLLTGAIDIGCVAMEVWASWLLLGGHRGTWFTRRSGR